MLPYINLFSASVRSYNLFITIGSIIGVLILLLFLKSRQWTITDMLKCAIPGVVLVIAGNYAGRIFRFLTHGVQSEQNIVQQFSDFSGSHFVGTVLLFAVFFPILAKFLFKAKKMRYEALAIVSVFLSIQHFFNRAACLMNGCCYGKPFYGPFGIEFNNSESFAYFSGVRGPVFPVQLFEMTGMIVVLLFLIYRYRKRKSIFSFFNIGFGAVVFISEMFMDNIGKVYFMGLTWIQLPAAFIFIIGVLEQVFDWERRNSYE